MAAQTSLNHQCPASLGIGPDAWKTRTASWPSPYVAVATHGSSAGLTFSALQNAPQGTLFHSAATGLQGSVYGDRTMLDVLDMGESGYGINSLGRYIVAALLNARSGRTSMLTEATVRNMWNDVVSQGYFVPTAGIKWGPAEVIGYLKTTM